MRQGVDIDGWGGAPAAVAVLHVTRSSSALAALLAELDPAEVCALLWSGGLGPAKEAESLDVIRRAGFIPQPCVNGARLEAGCVYLPPAECRVWFQGSCLLVGTASARERLSLDRVLQSLARAWGHRSIVMAPEPLGPDGERGMHAVRRVGGAVRVARALGSERPPAASRVPECRVPECRHEPEAPASRTASRSQRPPAPTFRVQRLFPCSPSVLARLQASAALAVQRAAARDRVRAWVPACKTGGFVYAVAMLLCEAIAEAGSNQRVQVFGTDPDEEALAVARSGRYPRRAAFGIEPRLREFYLSEQGEGEAAFVCVAEELREACFFSSHKLPRHAPFSRLDLIVCQRVFEGVAPSQRDDVVSELCCALRDEGVLFTLDHAQHFENGYFELAPEGHLQPRPSGARARASLALWRSQRSVPPSTPAEQSPEPARLPSVQRAATTQRAASTAPPPPAAPPPPVAAKLELELLGEAVGLPLLLLDDQLRVLHLSGAALHGFGLSPADQRLPLEALVLHLPGRRELLHAAARALETGATRELALGAGARTYLVRISVGQRGAGRVVALLFSDVSALEAATDRALLHRHQQAAVARLGELALGSCRLPALCGEALSLLVADIPVCRAGLIAECRADVPPLSVIASRGLGTDPLRTLRATGEAYELIERVVERAGRKGEALERAEVWAAGSCATQSSLEWVPGALTFGSAPPPEGGAAWAIVADGAVLGVIALYSARGGLDAPELQRFVQGVAHVLAAAMARERTRQRLELEREVDGVVAAAADVAGLGRGLLLVLREMLAAEALEIWCARPDPTRAWQRHFPELAPATIVPPWPAGVLEQSGPLYRSSLGSERLSELWLPVASREGVTAVLRASGVALRAPGRELEAGLAASARRLAPFFERVRAQGDVQLSEAERRRTLAELEALCESLPLGISIHDRSGALRHGLHLTSEPWLARLYAEELPAWIARVIDTGEAIADLELSAVSGAERRSWRCSIRPLRDDGGAPSGAIVVVHDPADTSACTEPPRATRARPRSSIEPRRWRVLIIADDSSEADALSLLLDPAFYAVQTATRVDDAVMRCLQQRPDLVLCDIDSPAIDLVALSEQIRAASGAGQPGLIALTRDSGALTRLRVEEAGFDDHLTQPVKCDALQRCLSRLFAAPAIRHQR
jgi:CheY-like chemotaxis protein/PAS domain-containing protein